MSKRKNKHSGHSGLNRFLSFLLVIVLLVAFWWFENYTLQIQKTEITSSKVTQSIRIIQLSDLHEALFGENNKRLKREVEKLNPDLIFVTGDMFTNGDTAGMDVAINLITDITKYAPVYFVPGEHDYAAEYLSQLEAAGVNVMCYKTSSFELKGNKVTIYGIDNRYYSETFDLHHEFSDPDPDRLNFLLGHIPNYTSFMHFGADVTFCGDTHGGVAQLPFLGPLYFENEWFPELSQGKKNVTDRGLFTDDEGHYMYVSPGLGNYPYPVRLFNRPEVSCIDIVPQ